MNRDWLLLGSQYRDLVGWFALDPVTGRRLHRHGQKTGAKGLGKSPWGAGLCWTYFCGPSQLGGFSLPDDPTDEQVRQFEMYGLWAESRLDANVRIYANSENQTANTWMPLQGMVPGAKREAFEEAHSVEIHDTVVRFSDGRMGTLKPTTSSGVSAVGLPVTFALFEETWKYTRSNGGHKLVSNVRENLSGAKGGGGDSMEVTNQPEIGSGSSAEITRKNPGVWLSGSVPELHPEIEHTGLRDPKKKRYVMAAIDVAFGDALIAEGGWIDPEDVYSSIQESNLDDEETTEDEKYQVWLNIPRKHSRRMADMGKWAALADTSRVVESGERIVLSFDGSWAGDSTALVGYTLDGERPHLFKVAIWEPPMDPAEREIWQVPRQEIREAVTETIGRFKVPLFIVDPSKYAAQCDDWAQELGSHGDNGIVYQFNHWSHNRVDEAVRLLIDSIENGSFTHSDDEVINRHIAQSFTQRHGQQRSKLRVVKGETSSRYVKIDATIATYQAMWGARLVRDIGSGKVQTFNGQMFGGQGEQSDATGSPLSLAAQMAAL